MSKESKDKRDKLLASLSDEQWKLWMEGENAKRCEQIAELYELNRGTLSWPKLQKTLALIAGIIAMMFTISKGLDVLNTTILTKNEEKRWLSEQRSQQNNGGNP